MQRIGKQVFISYRGKYYSQAEAVGQWLIQSQYCIDAILFPPNSLCERNEILLPYEYVELMEFILDRLAKCDAFVFLNTGDYQDSYFTQAEILQWRRFNNNPVVYPIGSTEKGAFLLGETLHLETLTKNQKKLWAGLSVSIARSYRGKFNPGFYGGKYNRSCYLIPCGNCGEHFLASKKAINSTLEGNLKIACPHCGNGQFRFSQGHNMGRYYRKAIILEQEFKTSLRILEPNEILSLLVDSDLPASIRLVTVNGESFSSDIGKLGWIYARLGVAALGALAVAALFYDEKSDETK